MRKALQCMVMRGNVMLKLFVQRSLFGRRWFFGLSKLWCEMALCGQG